MGLDEEYEEAMIEMDDKVRKLEEENHKKLLEACKIPAEYPVVTISLNNILSFAEDTELEETAKKINEKDMPKIAEKLAEILGGSDELVNALRTVLEEMK